VFHRESKGKDGAMCEKERKILFYFLTTKVNDMFQKGKYIKDMFERLRHDINPFR
jgi:hypothetical protein